MGRLRARHGAGARGGAADAYDPGQRRSIPGLGNLGQELPVRCVPDALALRRALRIPIFIGDPNDAVYKTGCLIVAGRPVTFISK